MAIKNFGTGTPRINEGVVITGSPNNNESLSVTGSAIIAADISNNYAAIIDNDASSAGHGLKVTSDGTGAGTNLFDIESSSTTVFRVRGDGKAGIGKVSALPAALLTVSSSASDSDLAIAHKIHHIGDADTAIEFDTDNITFAAGGSEELKIASDAILVKEYIKHDGDENTLIQFADDKIVLKAGNLALVTAEKNNSAPHEVTINDGGNNVDFVVKGNGSNQGNPGMKFDADTNKLGINGVGTPSWELDVAGDIGLAEYIYHRTDTDTFIQFEDDTIYFDAGGRNFIKIVEAGTDKLIINNGALDIDLQVKGENSANLIRTEAEFDSIYFGANSGAGSDNNFFVSGSISSKGTSERGTAVFGGDTVISGALHVKGGHDFQGTTAAAIVLDSTTASKIVWDSEDDGNSPDAAVYESAGTLYLSSSNDVRVYAGTDDILLFPRDQLQVLEDANASGNFATFYAQPSAGSYNSVLSVTDTGVVVNDSGQAAHDFRVESDSDSNMLFVDSGGNKVGVSTGSPHSGFHIDTSVAFPIRTITQNHNVTITDHTIFVNATSTNIDVTLPSAANIAGRQYIIKRVDTAGTSVTIQTDGSETIDGASSSVMDVKRSVIVQSDNNNWWIVAEYISPP